VELSGSDEKRGIRGIGGLDDWRMRSVWTLGFEPGRNKILVCICFSRSGLGNPTSGIGK